LQGTCKALDYLLGALYKYIHIICVYIYIHTHKHREAPGHVTPKVPYLLSDKVVSRIRLKEPNPPFTSPRISEPEYVKPIVARRHRSPLRNGFVSTRLSASPEGPRYVSPQPLPYDARNQDDKPNTPAYKAERFFVASPPRRIPEGEEGGEHSGLRLDTGTGTGHGTGKKTEERRGAAALILANMAKAGLRDPEDAQQHATPDGRNESHGGGASPSQGGLLNGIQTALVKMQEKQHARDSDEMQR
jgi:hypothetical protein